MKNFLLLFVIALFSWSDNIDESDVTEPAKNSSFLKVVNPSYTINFTEISISGQTFTFNSQNQTFTIDTKKLTKSGKVKVTLRFQCGESRMSSREVTAYFIKNEITTLTLQELDHQYCSFQILDTYY